MSIPYQTPTLYIDGQWLDAKGRVTEPVINPATEEPIGLLPHATRDDLDHALASSQRAFLQWRTVSPLERGNILRKAAVLIRERCEYIATQLTLEEGKPLHEARLEVLSAADAFDWYAEEGRRTYGRIIPSRQPGHRLTVLQEPVGPVAAFVPWNFPAVTPAKKIAGALAAGCSCILKPSEETPVTALCLTRALHDAGLPAGVLNVVFGVPAEVSGYLLASPVIAKASLTGSTAVGKQLARLASEGLKRLTLELGGHAPVLVCEDADPEEAAQLLVSGKYRNAGQVCFSPTRFYVHRSIHTAFLRSFVALTERLAVGDGLLDSTHMGPLANPRRLAAMERLLQDARQRGATVAVGGSRLARKGFFWQPTVVADVPDDALLMNEEPFGPVAMINSFATLNEAIRQANRLPYGLAAYAFTRQNATAMALGAGIQTGMLGINTLSIALPEAPFGGVKESGYGSEGGIEGLAAYMNTKLISER